MVSYIRSDLEFILQQIIISERQAAGENLLDILPNVQVPWGMRTVSGELNNLVYNQDQFGAADNLFPRLTDQEFRNDQDGDSISFGPPPAPTITNTNYGIGGDVVDADPRIISNLIVDQTLNNPAAIAAALELAGSEDVEGDTALIVAAVQALKDARADAITALPQLVLDLFAALQTAIDDASAAQLAADMAAAAHAAAVETFNALNAIKLDATESFIELLETHDADDPEVLAALAELNDAVDNAAAAELEAINLGVAAQDALTFLSSALVDQAGAQAAYDEALLFTINNFPPVLEAQANLAALTNDIGLTTSPGLDGLFGTADDTPVFFIPNVTPDAGLGAPFNAWMTFFGQFFDHGLDLVTKGNNGLVYIPLEDDDPLVAGVDGVFGTDDDLPASQRFMVLTRATQFDGPGADGIMGTADDTHHETQNTTSPFVDQNQTYSSHPSHQVFLREYVLDENGHPQATGRLITNHEINPDGTLGAEIGGMATWAVVKAQAAQMLGINLTDANVFDVPLLATDDYGNFIPDPLTGMPQVVTTGGLVSGNLAAPISLATAISTNHQFLIDIAHSANPVNDFGVPLTADLDDGVNTGPQPSGTYDDELLDAHYIAGDGRVNENIGLTAVHAIFHSEHNRLVEHTKQVLFDDAVAIGDVTFLNQWLLTPVLAVPSDLSTLDWDGERLFQAAKFGTEMQYQHLVFEEFARTVQPLIDEFLAPNGYDTTIDASIVAEFAHTVYRFGHSMLTEQFDRLDPNFESSEIGLIAAFLNPLAFAASGPTPEEATGAIVRGLTRQVGNEIDEFVTEAVRNNLLGLPLDLPAINIARGRDTGIPSLNSARAQFYAMTGDGQLKPYISWVDFAMHLKHAESLVNFIAAYGTHQTILDATTLADKRAAAMAIVFGGVDAPTDRLEFLNATGDYAGGSLGGLNDVDFWIGGLAEAQMPFGGLLGSTFNFVFETQLESLQNGDRFYYLSRTAGMHFGIELEQNSFAKLIMLNTDVTHLPDAVFSTPAFTLEVDPTKQYTGLDPDGRGDPTGGITIFGQEVIPLVVRDNPNTLGPDTNYLQYNGEDHVVLGGTPGDDIIISSEGDDTLYGDEGNDRLDGGFGNDIILGGDGDDIITDRGGDDNLQGGAGNDVIHAGNMEAAGLGNLILGGDGKDFIMTVEDISTTFGGTGDDFIYSAKTSLPPTGNEGDDWIEWGTQDGAPGDNFSPFLEDDVRGNDVFIGGGGFDEMIGEGGDDIFVGSDAQDKMDGMSGYDWVTYKNDKFGVTADLGTAIFGGVGEIGDHIALPFAASPQSILDRFAEVEGLSGTKFTDILRGDIVDATTIVNHGGATGGALTNPDVIVGLRALLEQAGISTTEAPTESGFVAGNIILGGDGSDIIEGRGGDDLIDGDKWLNVRISIRDPNDPSIEWATADSMIGQITRNPDPDVTVPPDITGLLHMLMLNGIVNPGQLQAVREILPGNGGFSFDTAVFSGNRADYDIAINNNGTPLDFSDDLVVVTDSVVGRDGVDRLLHIERLQFADQSVTLVPGLNAEPVGTLTILDNATGLPDDTPTEGQFLRVSIDGVTDADNPGGAITGQVTYVWQVERRPGSGVFEDIIDLPAGDLAFQSANGKVFRVTPDLANLVLRVKAIYQDANGVPEQVFSDPTAPVIDIPDAPPTPTVAPKDVTAGGEGIMMARSDLSFILDQIKIAEAHATGVDLLSLVPNIRAAAGLRSVTGEGNNLVKFGGLDQTDFGAADTVFPRVTTPVFRDAEPVPAGFGPPGSTSYTQTSGFVFDSQPRTISNLIVDQTANNPAAYATAYDPGANGVLDFGAPGNDDVLKDGVQIVFSPGLDGVFGTEDDREVFFFENVTPDVGLSAPFNAWMTFFGQFFDHGLDLVTKGGSGTIFIPLKDDDPLVAGADGQFGTADDLLPQLRFMVLTRATNQPGPDGILGTADDVHEHENTTSPFVDQNQTYTSHPSHQVFLRAYALDASGHPMATGKLITNRDIGADGQFGTADDIEIGGMATWKVVKAQARDLLGINLTDADFDNVPLLATDAYGNFMKGPNGFPLVMMKGDDGIADTADDFLVEGNPLAPIDLTNAVRTGHQFLIDVNDGAVPVIVGGVLQPDADTLTGNIQPRDGLGNKLTYDDELLDAHYIAGDGRVNENIGLTAVHSIFHSEHNRLVDQAKHTLVETAMSAADINEWLLSPLPADTVIPTDPAAIETFIGTLIWDGERLFQAAKFGTEMQYQHLVFEEFARTIQPNVDLFFAPTQVYDVDLDASIVAEFAHTVYRFGHSMLTETVDRFDANFNTIGDGDPNTIDPQLGLIAAFLNPLAFAASGPTPEEATSAIVRGVTRSAGNEIDEFVTEALRNNLLGLPLDLPAINIARGRDVGIPSFNSVRRQIYEQTGESLLKPYTSWADFLQHLKHPESVINFIAAYGTHSSVTDATTLADKRAAAVLLVLGGAEAPTDRLDFLNSTGAWSSSANGVTTTGLDDVDLWIGGLAEEIMPFGGMLGSTFNFIFENQLEKLQDGDRFYYLERTAGLSFNAELEGNSFAKLIMANTDAVHLPALVFTTPAFTLEADASKQYTGIGPDLRGDPDGVIRDNPILVDNLATPFFNEANASYLRYTGDEHVVLGGTDGDDILIASEGDDTIWGDAGNDRIDGGEGNDQIRGGAGDDIITDLGGDDNIQGGDGNDVIHGGNGINLIIGGFGSDFIVTGEDANESFGGQGNDFIFGTKTDEQNMGNEGDDWIEHGTSDGAPGDNFDPLGNDPIAGNDVYVGSGESDKFNAEGGDDIMVGSQGLGDRYIGASGYDWATFKDDDFGVMIDLTNRFFDVPLVPGSGASALTRFDAVEGLSGSAFGDVLQGDNEDAASLPNAGARGSVLTNIDLIDGLRPLVEQMLGGPVTFFDGGNIMLGGAGGDIIEGRGGDDLIDGDKWLNVRISVRANMDGTGPEIASFDSMEPLIPFMVNGVYNPGQLQIVREILTTTPNANVADTAVFSDILANYTVTTVGGVTTVAHVVGGAPGPDGTDRLMNVERLQFADETVVLGGTNSLPVGTLLITGSPAIGQPLTVSIANVTDADNPGGVITGPVTYIWQSETAPGVFEDILSDFAAGETSRTTGPTFIPEAGEAGVGLRVRAIYRDATGTLEQVYSDVTAPVVNLANVPAVGTILVVDPTPGDGVGTPPVPGDVETLIAGEAVTETETLSALTILADIIDPDGLTAAELAFQWQVESDPVNAPGVFVDIPGEDLETFTLTAAEVGLRVRVSVSFVDDLGTLETLSSDVFGPVLPVPAPPVGMELVGTSVDENADGAVIGVVTVNDPNPDDTFTFVIDDDRFEVVGGVLKLKDGVSLDFETEPNITISIEVFDSQGFPSEENPYDFDITVNDTNDAPTGLDIDPTAAVTGFDIGILTAIDPDAVDTHTIELTTNSETDNALFVIGANHMLSFKDPIGIDSNADGEYIIEIVTTDIDGLSIVSVLSITTDELVMSGTDASETVNGNDGANILMGLAGNDTLNGLDGDDYIDGGLGKDKMAGGMGNDTYVVDNKGDKVIELAGQGTDTVETSLGSYKLTADVENLVFTGTGTFKGTGNNLDNVITGGPGNNTLVGGAGNDTLNGGGGNDMLRGGAGDDVLNGGAGNDSLRGEAGNDTFVFHSGFGHDTIVGFGDKAGNEDILDVTGVFDNFADVFAAMQQIGKNVVITTDDGDTITLQKIKMATLDADDFRFV